MNNTVQLKQKFLKAAREGDLPTIQQCVKDHVDVNTLNQYGNTALGIAVYYQHYEVVQYLSNFVDINKFGPPRGRPATSWAIRTNRRDILKLILKKKPNLNIVDVYNETPFLVAIKNQQYDEEVVDILIEGGANINYDGTKTPLTCAVEENKAHVVKKLVELGADVDKCGKQGFSPLLTSVSKGNLELAKYLVDNGADVNYIHADGKTCLSVAVSSGNACIIKYLTEILKTKTPLFSAAHHGHLSTVQYLITHGFHIDATDPNGNTALTIAIKDGQEKVAKLLVQAGADVCKFVLPGQSPLFAAVETKNLSLVTYLLDRGARASMQTAFRKAIELGNVEIVKLLVEKGAQLDVGYRDGYSPLTVAADVENLQIIKFLTQTGAKINKVDGNGRCALGIAATKASFQIVKFLIDSGGDVDLAQKELDSFAKWNEDLQFFLKSRKAFTKVTGTGNEEW